MTIVLKRKEKTQKWKYNLTQSQKYINCLVRQSVQLTSQQQKKCKKKENTRLKMMNQIRT